MERSSRRAIIAVTTAALLLVVAARARAADPSLRSCASLVSAAHERQRGGHLQQARGLLLECARTSCGGELQRKCAQAATKLASGIAWIAPVATDTSGQPFADALLTMDGQPLRDWTAGHMLQVDPGIHEFTVATQVGHWPETHTVSVTRKVMIVEGQRGPLSIPVALAEAPAKPAAEVAMAPADQADADPKAAPRETPDVRPLDVTHGASPPSSPARGGRSAWTYVLGGTGILGVGAGALLYYWGNTDNAALARCTPNCQGSSVDHVQTMYIAADVTAGAGVLLLGTALWMFATSHPAEGATPDPSSAQAATLFDVAPTRSGAVATVRGVF